MFALGGHGLMVGGGSSVRRDDVGVVSVHQEGVAIDGVQMGMASTPPPPPREQFDRSLREVWIDKNKVELVLRMSTDADDDSMTTARAFGRTVFDPQRLCEWKRLVEERHWKSISFCHCGFPTNMGMVHATQSQPAEEGDAVNEADGSSQPPQISEQEEEAMWRGLLQPCQNHTQRLEMRGEFTVTQARVVSSLFGRPAIAASSVSQPRSSSCRLHVLCLSDVDLDPEKAAVIGDVIHGSSIPSCLKELSLSKCNVELGTWQFLLGDLNTNEDSDSSDGEVGEMDVMDMSQSDLHVNSGNEASMNITCEDLNDYKSSGKASLTPPRSSLSSSPMPPPVPPSLHSLYLSDCNLTATDVAQILAALRGHPMLRTLYLNGQQDFVPSQVDSHLITHLQNNPGIEQILLPSTNQHGSQIPIYTELNRCGRRLLHAQRISDRGMGTAAPMGLWPHVLERIRRLPRLSPSRKANAVYYFVKELHGCSTTGGSGGTRPPRKSSSSLLKAKSDRSMLTASTNSVMSSFAGSDSSNHHQDSSSHLPVQSLP